MVKLGARFAMSFFWNVQEDLRLEPLPVRNSRFLDRTVTERPFSLF